MPGEINCKVMGLNKTQTVHVYSKCSGHKVKWVGSVLAVVPSFPTAWDRPVTVSTDY